MPTTGGSPDAQRRRERLLDRAREARQLRERQRAAADAADRLLDGAADERGEAFGARAHVAGVLVQHAQHRDPLGRVEIEAQRPLERGERELVDPHRALQRVPAQLLDELGAADDDPGLRPAEELVAGEADEVGAGGERLARRRLARRARRATPEPRSSSERQAVPSRDGRELVEPRQLGEADDAEVRLVHAQEERRLRARPPARSRAARVRFVVPTSTSRAPERASTSGMRKPSPISISSPRETITSRPSASAASASSSAAALLFTTSAASAPVSRRRIAAT